MLATADDEALYSLEFSEQTRKSFVFGRTEPIEQIERELVDYFAGKLKVFKTPLCFLGTPFQNRVWEELQKIPHGETRSYAEIAAAIGKPSAFRAAAQANGANKLAIIVPCHRVINSSGALGGYSSGLFRKEWLLDLERKWK
jgi:AraC family transcriptional regulator of adaptative response/methylated-DNA-[protein]-cysteine methyltransferase